MTGRFIAVVGPSGAGKDTVMEAVCTRHPEIYRVTRVITRSPEAAGEDATSVSEAEFTEMVAAGAFALHWRAHGLAYGIPASVDQHLAEGRDVLANLSRAVLPLMSDRFERSMTVVITASADVLAQRLQDRGRESAEDMAKRLERADFALPAGISPVVIRNEGTLETAVAAFEAALQPERA
ncbi:phosphonate metabolism protein/1,5-bisphosphokinase (PRPP-forming) PhnN [Thalassobius vesicularis]|uniref:Ribose 1,5-bisphosphate phosphokinase PhnN n=1 Tax=Thalassobius vesicularis TaxID=1294297 RepID=A0A4S3MG49_9RHOB|nr:phosphonate metabolism protein/1,5-bisphosphokinase (PRPP-forming) PhnN [Thalassobius vesicularis]THD76714.1 phosphonate metabolism protein/1,5-bisphosphokinase (PRPP-forming) PhnN [Thalassobius vesicularis]